MKKTLIAATATVALLGAPAAASAHVTLNPRQAEAGSFSVLTVRVPNERDTKGTVKVDLRLPHGFYFLSYKKIPGWTAKLTKTKLDKPVTIEGLRVSREITRIVWTGDKKKGGIIEPDQFEEFPLLRPRPRRRRRLRARLPRDPDLRRRREGQLDRPQERRRTRPARHPDRPRRAHRHGRPRPDQDALTQARRARIEVAEPRHGDVQGGDRLRLAQRLQGQPEGLDRQGQADQAQGGPAGAPALEPQRRHLHREDEVARRRRPPRTQDLDLHALLNRT